MASGGAAAVDVADEHLTSVEGDDDRIVVKRREFCGGPSAHGGRCSVGLGPERHVAVKASLAWADAVIL